MKVAAGLASANPNRTQSNGNDIRFPSSHLVFLRFCYHLSGDFRAHEARAFF